MAVMPGFVARWRSRPARAARRGAWDLTALLNAADARASQPERHLWLIRLAEWLRQRDRRLESARPADLDAAPGTPWPVLRLRHVLNVLDRSPEHRMHVQAMLGAMLHDVEAATLLADFGFAPRMSFLSELSERLRLACLPSTPETRDLGALFHLLFTRPADADWLDAIDDATLARVVSLIGGDDPGGVAAWRGAVMDSITVLVSQIRASGFSAAVRQRMDASTLAERPFHQLARAAEQLRDAAEAGADPATLMQASLYLRALLEACRRAAASVRSHLEDFGVSVDVVFQVDQLRERTERVDTLVGCVVAPRPARETLRLIAQLVREGHRRRTLGALFSQHYSLLARKVAERHAETGELYITRDRHEWFGMLRKAAGGGAVLAITTFAKFFVLAIGLSAFWSGLGAGLNYAMSFVVIHLLHWTVATKQPAMTAPALAAKLDDVSQDAEVEAFVDEVAHLIRSQVAGIVGNLLMVAPVVLAVQWLSRLAFGRPLIGEHDAHHVLETLTLLGPSLLFAAFTGVLLFASSLIAGWVENWFVWHRLDSAIAWNPRFIARLGAPRARRWARWWRGNISGLVANVSLGLMLGLAPAVLGFFGLPIEVRHVTLSTGQIFAAAGFYGSAVLQMNAFWWCLAAVPLTGLLNVVVSFLFAFRLATRSRDLKVADRSRLYAAIRKRLRRAPGSFLWPPGTPPRAVV